MIKIEEIYGMGDSVLNHNPTVDQAWYSERVNINQQSGNNRPNTSPLKEERFLEAEWQIKIYNRIKEKNDIFAGVPPAAGKTAPLRRAWSELFINALERGIPRNSPEFPRILYIGKTKQLALEMASQNFLSWIYGLYSKLDNNSNLKHINLFLTGNNRVVDTSNLQINQNQINELQKRALDLIALKIGGINSQAILSSEYYFKPIVITTPIITAVNSINPISRVKSAMDGYLYDYTQIATLIKKYGKYFSIICIDEFQQYMPLPGKDVTYGKFTPDSEKHFDMILDIVKYAQDPGKCGIAFLTGTVNKNTAELLCKSLNSEFNRNFQTHIYSGTIARNDGNNPDTAMNRSKVVVTPFEKMSTPEERIKLVAEIVKNKQSRSIMVIFSVKRTTTTGIFNLMSQVVRILPARDPKSFFDTGEDTKIKNVADLEYLYGDKKNYISSKYDKYQYPTGLVQKEKFEVNDMEYLKYFNIDAAEQSGRGDSAPLLHQPDDRNLLYQGVLRGVGVMIGGMDDRMKSIIVRLFRSEKIYLLLATDSLGIGANVLCKHLYLPNLEKPDANGFAAIDDSSLIQLVNRAGRDNKIIPTAFIYCRMKDYPRIDKAVRSKPELFVSKLDSDELDDRIKNKKDKLRSLIRELL